MELRQLRYFVTLTEPASHYPWSVLWRAASDSGHVRAVVSCAQAMSQRLGWLTAATQAAQQPIRMVKDRTRACRFAVEV
jgi:hypothetical protein